MTGYGTNRTNDILKKRARTPIESKFVIVGNWKIMNINTVDRFADFSGTIVGSDHNGFYAVVHQRLGEIIRPDSSSLLRSVEMMMEDEHFHPAKKGKRLIA